MTRDEKALVDPLVIPANTNTAVVEETGVTINPLAGMQALLAGPDVTPKFAFSVLKELAKYTHSPRGLAKTLDDREKVIEAVSSIEEDIARIEQQGSGVDVSLPEFSRGVTNVRS